MTFGSIVNLSVRTITNPREALREVLNLDLPFSAIVQAAIAVAILSVLLPYALVTLMPNLPENQLFSALSPVSFFVTQILMLVLIAVGLFLSGCIFAGSATFEECFTASTWLQIVQLLLQLVQLIIGFAIPSLGGLIFMVAVFIPFYLLVQFARELQGFKNPFLVLLGIFVAANLVGLLIVFVLNGMGVSVAELIQNV